jgi:hypothetical protein
MRENNGSRTGIAKEILDKEGLLVMSKRPLNRNVCWDEPSEMR